MSKPLNSHSALETLLEVPGEGIYFAKGTTKPSDGAAGYAKGCIFIDTDASAGNILFCNEGTVTSADFDAVSVA
jgi:hypothetical protein